MPKEQLISGDGTDNVLALVYVHSHSDSELGQKLAALAFKMKAVEVFGVRVYVRETNGRGKPWDHKKSVNFACIRKDKADEFLKKSGRKSLNNWED